MDTYGDTNTVSDSLTRFDVQMVSEITFPSFNGKALRDKKGSRD